jgi:hypothetical protein
MIILQYSHDVWLTTKPSESVGETVNVCIANMALLGVKLKQNKSFQCQQAAH